MYTGNGESTKGDKTEAGLKIKIETSYKGPSPHQNPNGSHVSIVLQIMKPKIVTRKGRKSQQGPPSASIEQRNIYNCPENKIEFNKYNWYGHTEESHSYPSHAKKIQMQDQLEAGFIECWVNKTMRIGFVDSGSDATIM